MAMSKTQHVDELISKIVEVTYPERIYWLDDCFLIIASSQDQRPIKDYVRQLAAVDRFFNSGSYSILSSKEIETLLNSGHLYYSSICRVGNLVYQNSPSGYALPLESRLAQVYLKASKEYYSASNRANNFLGGASLYLAQGHFALATFMLHQATEQILRGMILAVTGHEVRSHNIEEISPRLNQCCPKLKAIIQRENPSSRGFVVLLDRSYVCGRYNNHFAVPSDVAFALMAFVNRLIAVADTSFQELIGTADSLQRIISHPLTNKHETEKE